MRAEGGGVSSGWGAIYGGWLLPDQIVEMTKGKLSYQFCRSLRCNDATTARKLEGGQSEIHSALFYSTERTKQTDYDAVSFS